MNRLLDGSHTMFIGRTVDVAALDSRAGEPVPAAQTLSDQAVLTRPNCCRVGLRGELVHDWLQRIVGGQS